MLRTCSHKGRPLLKGKRHQQGQALIYGIFVMIGGLAALFFLFNTGQLTREKTKLVNTADAVAYSAGVLHARALNFDAYTNRALVANEVIVAQMVSLSSWAQFTASDMDNLPANFPGCYTTLDAVYPWIALMIGYAMYLPPELLIKCVLYELDQENNHPVQKFLTEEVPPALDLGLTLVEVNKGILKLAGRARHATGLFEVARYELMKEVADKNYNNDGDITVMPVPGILTDDWNSFTERYTDTNRTRFAEVTRIAASKDQFTNKRYWNRSALLPSPSGGSWCFWVDYVPDMGYYFLSKLGGGQMFFTAQDIEDLKNKQISGANQVRRRGGTELINFDEWRAEDTQSLYGKHTTYGSFFGIKYPNGCDWNSEDPMAWGQQQAYNNNQNDEIGASYSGSPATNPQASNYAASSSSTDWTNYTGLPAFYDLSDARLKGDSDPKKDARLKQLQFTVLLKRATNQTMTSEGRSQIKGASTVTKLSLNNYHAHNAADEMTAISTSEVFFQRPTIEKTGAEYQDPPDGSKNNIVYGEKVVKKPSEIASLFNPYWQVRLVDSSADLEKARLLQNLAVSP
jgi:Putative Flp pilus-assembly TadE/G-like